MNRDSSLEFIAINAGMHTFIDKVLASSTIPEYEKWTWIYENVFSDLCSRQALAIHDFDWCDPDTDYQDDVMAFVSAFDDEVEKIKTLL